eukprot:GHVL01039614.1.p1 GENE.GHVL01039614.1~~GHVL01039614.1.p1  ORF type:complete len:205 (-),score=46.06 GHVL01039614.1:636-1250(-)
MWKSRGDTEFVGETAKEALQTVEKSEFLWRIPKEGISEQKWKVGIDEAGRGPVLGPMLYAAAFSPVDAKIDKMGFADSKQLSEEQRVNLFDAILVEKEMIGWRIHAISPEDISASMLKKNKYNLNTISHDSAANMIDFAVSQGVNITEAYIDTVGDPQLYRQKLEKIFPNIKFTVESKADDTYSIVSAASILAKVNQIILLISV